MVLRPADLVVDNRSDLVKVVAAPVVGQRTYRDARGPIYDVSVADVRQAGHVDWPGSSSANETLIPKPSIFLIGASICMGTSLMIDLAQSPYPSPAAFRPAGVYNDNFRTLMPDRETACWTSDCTLLRPELCNNEIALDPCRIRFSISRKNCMGVVLGGTSRMTVPMNSTVLRAAIVVDPAEPTQSFRPDCRKWAISFFFNFYEKLYGTHDSQ
ncbi:hypothetical protein L6452_05153 [Arctium lappa]|uniref:Uncharacterized protein n=1 Tax=Arctium lappa TaxID=4217 RepID=A0ACB9EFW8_ARCLA|nr:hypothetical protein L6452_05153 [Arctium lappa]